MCRKFLQHGPGWSTDPSTENSFGRLPLILKLVMSDRGSDTGNAVMDSLQTIFVAIICVTVLSN